MTPRDRLVNVTKDEAWEKLRERLLDAAVVLDIGPGICPQAYVNPCVHICAEPHLPYIHRLRQQTFADPRYVILNCTWQIAMKVLPDKSVDTVFAMDVIEHLTKEDGYELIREAQRVARQQVIIYTPWGFFPQSYEDPNKPDRWGLDGGFWQTHRSGWSPEDFDDKWEVLCCDAYHLVDQNEKALEKPFGAIWAICNLTAGSEVVGEAGLIPKPELKRMSRAWITYVLEKAAQQEFILLDRRKIPSWLYCCLRTTLRVLRYPVMWIGYFKRNSKRNS